jgi:hypothetical protein
MRTFSLPQPSKAQDARGRGVPAGLVTAATAVLVLWSGLNTSIYVSAADTQTRGWGHGRRRKAPRSPGTRPPTPPPPILEGPLEQACPVEGRSPGWEWVAPSPAQK